MKLPSAMILAAPRASRPSSRSWIGVLAASLAIVVISAGSAAAQTSPKTQEANAQWRKLSQTEVDCVDKALRARDSNLWNLIRRGLGPLDPTAAKLRADCRAKTTTTTTTTSNRSTATAGASQTSQAKAPKREASREQLRGYWTLNGTTLSLVADGDLRKFYELPSEAQAGVQAGAQTASAAHGALLLEGKIQDKHFVGTAYRYSSRCGLVSYRVDGMFLDNNRRLELQGQSPRTNAACATQGTELASLTLKALDSSFAVARAVAGAEVRAEARAETSDTGPSRAAVRNAATGNVQDEKVVADSVAAEPPAKVTVDRAAAARPVAKRATADEPAAEKIVPDKVVVENADVMQIASIDKGVAAKSETAKTDAVKAEAVRAAAENGAAEVVVPVIPIAARGVATDNSKTPDRSAPAAVREVQNRFQEPRAANLPAAARPATESKVEATKALAAGDIARTETATAIAAAISTSVAAETRLSFVYGLLSGLAAAGALVLLYFALQRKWRAPAGAISPPASCSP